MIRRNTLLVVLAGVVLIAASAQAAIIDDFTEGSVMVSDSPLLTAPASVSQDSLDPAHVMGGKRTMTFSSDTTGMAVAYAYVESDPGLLAIATPSTFEADLTLLWDGGPMDIIPNGENAIEVTVDNADHAGKMTITLTDTDGSIVAVEKSFSAASNFALLFTEADFADPANEIDYGTDGFDPTMTQSIELLLDGSPAGDYQLSLVQTVPEPATMAILMLGGLGALTSRRRREPSTAFAEPVSDLHGRGSRPAPRPFFCALPTPCSKSLSGYHSRFTECPREVHDVPPMPAAHHHRPCRACRGRVCSH